MTFGLIELNMINKNYKIDLHTHSILSKDGGINKKQYQQALNTKILDYIAITDHNEIAFALKLQQEIGPQIIVGEEIKTQQGEIIGLYLTEIIPAGLSLETTIRRIKEQQGLLYIPHPFDLLRSGLKEKDLNQIQKDIDMIETFNSRSYFRFLNNQARKYSVQNKIPQAVGSDAHSYLAMGRTYNIVNKTPTRNNLIQLIKTSTCEKHYLYPWQYFAPKINQLKKAI